MPHTDISIVIDEPLPELIGPVRRVFEGERFPVFVPGESIAIIDSSEYLHDEAVLLDAGELAEARVALIDDGIFPGADWMLDDGPLRAGVKYGWALAHLSAAAAESPLETLAWSVANGFVTTTTTEWSFLPREVAGRAPRVHWIAPCTPFRLEPGIEYAGDLDAFQSWLAEIDPAGSFGVMFPHAEEKLSLLPMFSRRPDLHVAFSFSCLGWIEALRLIARTNSALFRDLLPVAQERFVFDKGPHALSTAEDDVRSLPSVSDAELETTLLGDFRGRQLLQVTAHFLVGDEERGQRIAGALAGKLTELEDLIAASVRRHVEALQPK